MDAEAGKRMTEERTASRATGGESAGTAARKQPARSSRGRAPAKIDLTTPERFINRELSWVSFNARVLEEAWNTRHPLLERVRFLSISANNLDEFNMVRVAGLWSQVELGVETVSQDGRTPAQQLKLVRQALSETLREQQRCLRALKREMREHGIRIVPPSELTKADRLWLERRFNEQVFPVLTPLAIDPAHPFPFIPNGGIALVLELQRKSDGTMLNALVRLPSQVGRFVRLPGSDEVRMIAIEEMVYLFLDHLFPGYDLVSRGEFRVLRDSDIEIEEEAEDLVRLFESALKRRRRGSVIHLEVDDAMPEHLREFVARSLVSPARKWWW